MDVKFKISLLVISLILLLPFSQKVHSAHKNLQNSASVDELYNLSLDDNLVIPDLGNQAKNIKKLQAVQAKRLAKSGYFVETTRGGEVIIVTIKSNDLFLPNEKTLKSKAGKLLSPFLKFLERPDYYRMMLVMHSDNTGSQKYTENLTNERVMTVLDWFQKQAKNSDYIIPYGMGAEEPLYPNNSMNNRLNNRRLEIYLVPGTAMLKDAEQKTLRY